MNESEAQAEQSRLLVGRALYHTAPLHYVPRILQTGMLLPKSALAADRIAPRASAKKRDFLLSLQDYVHFSFRLDTPLLAHKTSLGYAHAVFEFDAQQLCSLQLTALLTFNTKAWRSRSDCKLIEGPQEQAHVLDRHFRLGKFPSLEFLVRYGVDIGANTVRAIHFIDKVEENMLSNVCSDLALPCPQLRSIADNSALPLYAPSTRNAVVQYFDACSGSHAVLPPPQIAFD